MTAEPKSLRTSREETIDALCRRFAADDLSLGELERRLEKVRAARTRNELHKLLADLPGPELPARSSRVTSASDRSAARGRRPSTADMPEAATASRPSSPGARPPSARVKRPVRTSSQLAFAVMGGTHRAGRWAPPTTMVAVAIMGGVELDFREAVLSGDVVDINCFAFWGAVEIVVPPDVHVDTHGFAVMGGFEQSADIEANPDPGAPTLRINGIAFMGAVEVRVAERGAKLPRKDWNG